MGTCMSVGTSGNKDNKGVLSSQPSIVSWIVHVSYFIISTLYEALNSIVCQVPLIENGENTVKDMLLSMCCNLGTTEFFFFQYLA